MKYYKSETGMIHAYELDGSQDAFIPDSFTKMTEKEVAAHFKIVNKGQLLIEAKAWRDDELARSDIELSKVLDGMGTGTEKDWRDYRCKLRQWPETKSFPKTRPTAPDA